MDGSTYSYESMSREELEAEITELAGHLNAAMYRWLTLIAEFDRRKGWHDGELASCAHWLNFKVGLNLGAAREKMRVAHALPALPKVAAAMARGELSYSKVRALTRVATPATEDALLMIAHHGTAYHVERVVQGFRRALQAEELSREARQQANRGVSFWYDSDGSLVLKARLPALAGAQLVKAIDAGLNEVPTAEPWAMRRADSLAIVAETFLTHASQGARGGATADQFQVVVHVDAEALAERGAGRCEMEHGPALAVETVRRLSCDASMVRIVESESGEPLDVGRKTRVIPPAIRRALNSRDAGCCFPGCTSIRYLDAHHIEHWVNGGETKLSNLVSLCRRHHRLVHEGGAVVESVTGGGFVFRRPDGRRFEVVQPTPPVDGDGWGLRDIHERDGWCINERTAETRWRGERISYDLGVWVLCQQHARGARGGGDVSAETPDV